eukprot:scaffold705_cov402-Prasinococcus_capsulatus_cf.AAC.49
MCYCAIPGLPAIARGPCLPRPSATSNIRSGPRELTTRPVQSIIHQEEDRETEFSPGDIGGRLGISQITSQASARSWSQGHQRRYLLACRPQSLGPSADCSRPTLGYVSNVALEFELRKARLLLAQEQRRRHYAAVLADSTVSEQVASRPVATSTTSNQGCRSISGHSELRHSSMFHGDLAIAEKGIPDVVD